MSTLVRRYLERLATASVWIVVMIGAAGCVAPDLVNDAPTASGTSQSPWIAVPTYAYDDGGGMDAGVLGTLAAFEGCLVVRPDINQDADPDHIILVMFPENEVSFPSKGVVNLFGKAYHLGDSVSFDGGAGGWSWTAYPPGCKSAWAQATNSGTLFIVWNG